MGNSFSPERGNAKIASAIQRGLMRIAGNQEPSAECILMTEGTSPERSEIQSQIPAFMQPQIIPSVIQESTLEQSQSLSGVFDPDCSTNSGRVLSNRVNSQG